MAVLNLFYIVNEEVFLFCVLGESVNEPGVESRLGGGDGHRPASRLCSPSLQPSSLRPLHIWDHWNTKGLYAFLRESDGSQREISLRLRKM